MHLTRGRAPSIAADREATARLLERARDGAPAVRVWTPHRQVAFGRRDARLEGYDRARATARERGFPPVERGVGGRAVAFDGETTVAVARAEPVADFREGLEARYEAFLTALERALAGLGIETVRGEPPNAFCPGSHSLSVAGADDGRSRDAGRPAGGKLAGVAQRVRGDAALVSAVLVVERESIAPVLEAVYGALEVPFDPESLGSVAAAGGPSEPDRVVRALEAELVGEATPTVEDLEA